ncbi:MAG: hypothetical protein ABGX36_03830 [Cycloclasticus sp.]|jgi:(2Fe-2S) ferredoxin
MVNNAACLDRCGQGSVLVIYPEETRYQYKTKEDIDEIFERQIKSNQRVTHIAI